MTFNFHSARSKYIWMQCWLRISPCHSREHSHLTHALFWSCAAPDRAFTRLSHRQKISHLCLPCIDSKADLWHAELWAPSWRINLPPPDGTHISPKLGSPSGPPSPLQSGLFAIRHALHVVRLLFMTPEHRLTCADTHTHTHTYCHVGALRRRRAPASCHLG